jgi:hypothetical protein
MHKKYTYLLFCLLFLTFNLLQSFLTNLSYDEAYYWLYSQHLAWGYFDHPPLIAFFIKIGYSIFNNELGLRLIGALSNFLILLIIPKILDLKDLNEKIIILIICATLPLFQLLGFISTPDAPLLLFSCLYFYFLKTFYANENFKTAILLGLTMALMAYSKYHTFLLVFLTILSNWKLLKNKLFISAMIIAIIAFLPHIFWQLKNDFISFRFHLSGRHNGMEIYHFPEYLGNVLLIFNPFMLIFILKSLKSSNITNDFNRSLRFIMIGTFFFFLMCNFLGHVQPQWFVITLIPTIILLFNYFQKNKVKQYNLKKIFLISSTLFLFIRLVLIFDILPYELEFHEYETKINGALRKSKGLPVIFNGNYRLASVYAFRTKNKNVHCVGNKSAFGKWNNGTTYINKPVMIYDSNFENSDTINFGKGQIQKVSYIKKYLNESFN